VLLIYCVVVFLLAWWPWNLLLILCGTHGGRLQSLHEVDH
jgi:hypothetical protein